MSMRGRAYYGFLFLVVSLTLAAGCAKTHDCQSAEACNGLDDDCDGLIDEGFLDDEERYSSRSHCGSCEVDCDAVFASAESTECVEDAGDYVCRLVSCPSGEHLSGDGACVPDVAVGCLPCVTDDECERYQPGARCIGESPGGHCVQPCGTGCPEGYECAGFEGMELCFPEGGDCVCNAESFGMEYACRLTSPNGDQCVGRQECSVDGVLACTAVLEELCNGIDEDCDGALDEGFVVDGVYLSEAHCGACGSACPAPGPNMDAECTLRGAAASCEVSCSDGFVDVDGILANGCECERRAATGAPIGIDTDGDCDGVVDDSDEFVFVTAAGNDRDPGTLARPMRSLSSAIARAESLRRDVLVARGVYAGTVTLRDGVSVFGGYRPDFQERDLDLYPVRLEAGDASGGTPVVRADGIRSATAFSGFEVVATDAASAGGGSSGIYLNQCGSELRLLQLRVFAGQGADGVRGASSVDALRMLGVDSLGELDGVAGGAGAGAGSAAGCRSIRGGGGGVKTCFGRSVSGGAGGGSSCAALSCNQSSPCGNAGCTDFTVGGVCDLAAVLASAVPNAVGLAGQGISGGEPGEPTYDSPTNRGQCFFCDDNAALPRTGVDGGDGANGEDGNGGIACSSGFESFDVATGLLRGGAGLEGTDGESGSGGGGGSSGSGYAVIGGTEGMCDSQAGGSGGGGGSGGCGAPGAMGGTGGGASVGVVIRLREGLDRGPSLESVEVVTSSGGRGGDGGAGASGGGAGTGLSGGAGSHWCSRIGGRGGNGGRGGAAGGGGGGCGGGVYGIYVVARTDGPSVGPYIRELDAAVSVVEAGLPGSGGRGGFAPRAAGGNGLAGSFVSVRSSL